MSVDLATSEPCRLTIAEDGRVLVIALDQPPHNYLTPAAFEMIDRALEQLLATPQLSLAVVLGTGRNFSKGFSVDHIRAEANAESHRHTLETVNAQLLRLQRSPKPVIAAIDGACLGGGLELALACHLRLATPRARLGLPELSAGLLPGFGGIHRLVKCVGRAEALEMLWTGRFVPAEEARALGLVNRVLEGSDFWESVLSFVRGLLSVQASAIQDTLRLVDHAEAHGDEDCIAAITETIVARCHGSPGAPALSGGNR